VSYNEVVRPLKSVGTKRPPRKVFVRDLVLDAEIGVHAHEKNRRQDVAHDDQLENVVCYEDIVNGIKAILDDGHVNLVESLAETIAGFILDDPRVIKVTVGVEKLDAIAEAASVGVEIERNRDS
jgi:7,8-dihydroneopterin aldolase/epimerase/oxygenase